MLYISPVMVSSPLPDVQFSRIRFLGHTRFRACLHSYPLQGSLATHWLFLSCPFSHVYPARLVRHEYHLESFVLPWGPSPCGWLSQPRTTMPHKTPQQHIAIATNLSAPCSRIQPEPTPFPGFSPFRVPTPSVSSLHLVQEPLGLPGFSDVSLPACHGLMTPPDLHSLAKPGISVLPSVYVKTLGIRN